MTEKRYSNFIIDSNNLFYRSFYNNTQKVLFHQNEIYTGGISTFLNKINNLLIKYGFLKETKIWFLFDNPESTINLRKLISNGLYKNHRKDSKDKKIIYTSLNILIEILKNYSSNFRISQLDYCEAEKMELRNEQSQ